MSDNFLSPLSIGSITLPNRVCFPAHRTNFSVRGRLTDQHIAYYSRRARGKCGMIILGEICIHPDDRPWESMIEIFNTEAVRDFRRITDAVHQYGTLMLAQLNHHGFQSSGSITRKAIWGPSANADIVFGETSKPMETEDFETVIKAFSDAALIARESGFDGIEIDIGQESLLRQFLSPLTNFRRDEYGGSVENRIKFPLDVLKAVRKAIGNDFTVGVRLCADEKFWGAITLEDSVQFAERFVSNGKADFINVTVGTYYSLHMFMASMHVPPGFALDAAEGIKKSVSVPVIACHQITTPQMVNEIIEKEQADAAGMVRSLICDPDFTLKAMEGRADDIRYCVRDNKGCIGRVNNKRKIECIQNPEVGREEYYSNYPFAAEIKKRVMVIGAGPAGMEAAITAAEKGHDVIIYEKEDTVGGQINLIKKRPRRQGMGGVINYLQRNIERLEIPVKTGIEVNSSVVSEHNPDVVIVATGSFPAAKPVPGDYQAPDVLTVNQVLGSAFSTGEKILFIDENGNHHSISTVEFLADQGKKVDMITSDLFIGVELSPLGDLSMSRQRLLQSGVTFKTDLMVDEIQGKRVVARDMYTNKPVIFDDYDTIILDMGNVPCDGIYKELKGKVKELYRAGDCVAPRGIDMAILEGRKAGERI